MDSHDREFPLEKGFDDQFYMKQIKSLRSKISHFLDSSNSKVIGITSSADNEGKTTLSVHLSISLSSNGEKKVLLIDGDLIKCSLTRVLGFYGEPGLSDYLNGHGGDPNEVIKGLSMMNLNVISSGKSVQNSADLLTKNSFHNLISKVSQEYDVVLVDLPPVISTPDPVSVRKLIDKYIFTYHAGVTPRGLLETAINDIGEENVLGVVFNRAEKEQILKYKKHYYYYGDK